MPLSQGLDLLSENVTTKNLLIVSKNIKDLGSYRFSICSKLSGYWSIIVGLIEAGEAGGILSKVLDRIALLLEEQNKLRANYRCIDISCDSFALALTVSLALLIFIVPTFEELFDGLGAKLPALTQLMLDLSRIVIR